MDICVIEETVFLNQNTLIKNAFNQTFKKDTLSFVTHPNNSNIDILILNASATNLQAYFDKLNNSSIIIVNIDDPILINTTSSLNANIIAFGYNPKASITLSSFITGNINTATICIQRELETISKNIIEEQEFQINTILNEQHTLLIASLLLVLDINPKQLKNIIL